MQVSDVSRILPLRFAVRAFLFFPASLCLFAAGAFSQMRNAPGSYAHRVNVFLGTAGDHGQLSPSASFPFGLFSVGPETDPGTHTGYDNRAKVFTGFSHTRMEGVGCRGSGGHLLIKPFISSDTERLVKATEEGRPGYYAVRFSNGIHVALAAGQKAGIECYRFPGHRGGLCVDLSHALTNGFLAETHLISGQSVTGWVSAGTTCREGAYRLYYCLIAEGGDGWQDLGGHRLKTRLNAKNAQLTIRVGLSSVDTAYARREAAGLGNLEETRISADGRWNNLLANLVVSGEGADERLFYSLLYRVMQSPFAISEKDGSYRGIDASLQKDSTRTAYNGWAIWDNYRTQLPLLALGYPSQYQDIVTSVAGLYRFGKKDWATMQEPSNSVRTEHAMVVLLDAFKKGYRVPFGPLFDSLKSEVDRLDFSHPDKALESAYDTWAFSEICSAVGNNGLAAKYLSEAREYRTWWKKDFADLTKPDVDRMGARGMYQGTIWQYRWLVPYDLKGLIALCGGEAAYLRQLDEFFDRDLYNAANETDIQVPSMYNGTSEAWKSQALIRRFAIDTVVQLYTDVQVRGVDPTIDRIFNNRPEAFLRSMDDDAGAMSGWWLFAALGLSQGCVGTPIYYLHVPFFHKIHFTQSGFTIEVKNAGPANCYIKSATLNGKPLRRAWITHAELTGKGSLVIEASPVPNPAFGAADRWMTALGEP